MANSNNGTLTIQAPTSLSDEVLTRIGSNTEDTVSTLQQVKDLVVTLSIPNEANSSGTAYTLTTTSAKIDFGSSDPTLAFNASGLFLIVYDLVVNYVGATFAANQTITSKVRRTNNTAADIANSSRTITTDIVTTATGTIAHISGSAMYTTPNTNDNIELWASVSVLPSVGSVQVVSANIKAIRMQQ